MGATEIATLTLAMTTQGYSGADVIFYVDGIFRVGATEISPRWSK